MSPTTCGKKGVEARKDHSKPDLVDRIQCLPVEDKADILDLIISMLSAGPGELGSIAAEVMNIVNPGEPEDLTPIRVNLTRKRAPRLKAWKRWVATTIKQLRTDRDWTQEELAKRSGLPQSHISRIEQEKISPSHKTIDKLAKAFGVCPNQIDPGM